MGHSHAELILANCQISGWVPLSGVGLLSFQALGMPQREEGGAAFGCLTAWSPTSPWVSFPRSRA